jgi:shikimate dehydrogenase
MIEKALDRCGLDWRYVTLDVAPEDLGDAVRGMRAMGFAGGNCAEPHKQAVIPHLDRTTELAGTAGVVNLISRDENGLVGDNTEGKALLESLRPHIDPVEKRFVLLGAGRVARAIGLELAGAGAAEILVVDRTEPRAEELAALLTGRTEATGTPVVLEGY